MLARRPHELSGGQQQRVALARALARQPRLMLLDEPFSALDTGLREATRKSVARVLGEAGITTMLVTHDQAEALSFGDQVAMLEAGRIKQSGTADRALFAPGGQDDGGFPRRCHRVAGDRERRFRRMRAGTDCDRCRRVAGRCRGDAAAGAVETFCCVIRWRRSACTVTAVEFCGPHCMMTVSLDGSKVPLSFRVPTLGGAAGRHRRADRRDRQGARFQRHSRN